MSTARIAFSRLAIPMLAGCLALAGCGRQDGTVDPATQDKGAFRNPPIAPADPVIVTLPNGTQITATTAISRLADYLASDRPAGETFALPSIRFANAGEVRSDPDGALSALAAVVQAHPDARVRVEVVWRNPGQPTPSPEAAARAERVRNALIANGMPEGQVSAAGVRNEDAAAPYVQMVVTAK